MYSACCASPTDLIQRATIYRMARLWFYDDWFTVLQLTDFIRRQEN